MPQALGSKSDVLRVFGTKQETRAFYNKISKVYDLLAEHSEEPVRRAALTMLSAVPGEKVLELGFGTGHSLVAIAGAVGPAGGAWGLDLSEKMAAHAIEVARQEGLAGRVRVACGDGANLPFAPSSFDAIFICFTLELFDTPEIPVVLKECARVLRPAGRLVVAGMSKEAKHELLVEAFEWSHRHFPNFVDCRPIHVQRSMEAAGFAVTGVARHEMWVPVEIVRASAPGAITLRA